MIWRILALATLAGCVVAGNPSTLKQGMTVHIPRDFTGQRFPRFENGFVIAYDFDRVMISSYDRSGKTLMEVPLVIPGARRIQIRNIAAAPDGTVAVTGSASDDQGSIAPMIFWISPAAAITRVVRTAPFSASQIAFAGDGSLWAAGRVYSYEPGNPAATQFNVVSEYDVLRHYDSHGRLQQTALPRSILGTHDPASQAFLLISQDRIGFFTVQAKKYIELSLAGVVRGQWTINSTLPENDFGGAALTPSGAVFVSMRPQPDPNGKEVYEGPPVYQLDKTSGALQLVQILSTGPTKATLLVGNDGEELVFYSKPPAAVSWFAAQ